MPGHELSENQWLYVVYEMESFHLMCPSCLRLMKDPVASPRCDHKFCRSCLKSSRNSWVACPVDTCNEEALLWEIVPDEKTDEQIKSLEVPCPCEFEGEPCTWKGRFMHLEAHQKKYHCKGEASAKKLGETKKSPQHGTQLNPVFSPNCHQDDVAGPSGMSRLNPQDHIHHNPLTSDKSLYDNSAYKYVPPKSDGDQSQQNMYDNDNAIAHLNQLFSLCATVDALEQKQSTDHNDIEELKRNVAVLNDELAEEKQNNRRLSDELRTALGKIQALEQEAQKRTPLKSRQVRKKTRASTRDECVAEREPGAESMANALLLSPQDNGGRL